MPGSDSHMATCAVVASNAARIISTSNGMAAANLISMSMAAAGFNLAGSIADIKESGEACVGGAHIGDVFFDTNSAAIFLGGNEFAECPIGGGACTSVGWRAFSGGCRRYC